MYLLFFRWTLILSSKYANILSPQATPSRQSSRKSFDKCINSPLFPTSCFVCKKERIQRKKKNEYPVTVHTLNVECAIKAAAKVKNLTYFEIKDADLIARELRYHKSCYKAFTEEPTLSASHTQSVDEQSNLDEEVEEQQQTGDFESVCEYITHHVLDEKTAVSMSVLHTIYGLRPSDSRFCLNLKVE